MLSPFGTPDAPHTMRDAAGANAPDVAELTVTGAIAPIEGVWRTFERTAAGHVFQSVDFVAPWVDTIGAERGVDPRIVIGRATDGDILFILPLGVRRSYGRRRLEWLGGAHADYHCGLYDPRFLAGLAAAPERADAFPETIVRLFEGEADVVHFSRQPPELAGWPNPFARHKASRHPVSSHETRLGTGWETYYRGKRNSAARRKDRTKLRNLEALGPVRLIDAASPEDVTRVMEALFAQKERGLTERGVVGFFDSPAVRAFYSAVALRPYPHGPAHVAALECGGEIVATNWGLVRADRYYYVMHSFADVDAARFSPGRQLMYHLMQWCIARGIGTFDFTIGDEDFKSHWCEDSYPLYDSVVALGGRGVPLSWALRSGTAAKRAVKASRIMRPTAERVRRYLSVARRRAQTDPPAVDRTA